MEEAALEVGPTTLELVRATLELDDERRVLEPWMLELAEAALVLRLEGKTAEEKVAALEP